MKVYIVWSVMHDDVWQEASMEGIFSARLKAYEYIERLPHDSIQHIEKPEGWIMAYRESPERVYDIDLWIDEVEVDGK